MEQFYYRTGCWEHYCLSSGHPRSYALRRALRTSENFAVHHPLFDITLVSLLVLAAIVSQTVGNIY